MSDNIKINQDLDFNNLITICVPTYNRYEVLLECIEDLIRKTNKYQIRILIIDNCSTDDTYKIKRYADEYDNITYFRQDSNKGYDINFETALLLSKTPYTWVLSDANRLNEKNLHSVLSSISKHKPDAYIVNTKKRVKLAPKTYTGVNDLITDLGWHMTMLSATIFSKKIIENANFIKYRNTNFLHFGVLFEYFANVESFNVLWENQEMIYPSKLSKSNSWNPYRVAEIFGKDWSEIVLSLPDNIDHSAKLECIKKHGKYTKLFSFKHLRKQRAVNGLNKDIYSDVEPYIQYFAPGKGYLIKMVSMMPNVINTYYWKNKIKKCSCKRG